MPSAVLRLVLIRLPFAGSLVVTVEVARVPVVVRLVEVLVEVVAAYRATRSGRPGRLWVAVVTGPLLVFTVDASGAAASAST